MIRHDDWGLIPCLAVGRALQWAERLIPITCLAVGLALRWAEAIVTSASGDGSILGSLYDIHVAYCICMLVSFLSYHSLRCYNLILGVSYPWDI